MITIGLFVTLVSAVSGLYSALVCTRLLRKLPSRMEPAYDETVAPRSLALRIAIAAELVLPFIVYAVFSAADPELFRTELF